MPNTAAGAAFVCPNSRTHIISPFFQRDQRADRAKAARTSRRVSTISEDPTPGRRVHDPKHPSADAEGYVTYSNVNAVEEMVNMISASRSYQNNLEVMNTAKSLLLKTIQLGQS